MSNVLSEEKQKQVLALGQLGWSLRRIEKTTGVRRETAAGYLRGADIPVRSPGAWGKRPPAKPANGVTTDSVDSSKPANAVTADSLGEQTAKPANEVTTGSSSISAADRDLIEEGRRPTRPEYFRFRGLFALFDASEKCRPPSSSASVCAAC